MTSRAREVLGDCRVALSLLETETDMQRWRVHWAAAVALVRAVGHVLEKVDGSDPAVKEAAALAFKCWKSADPEHDIFRDFIELERNNLLKEYRSAVHPLETVAIAVEVSLSPVNGGDPQTMTHVAEIGENIYRPMLDGPWEGHDAREVLTEAIEWWERQLTSIDRAVEGRRTR